MVFTKTLIALTIVLGLTLAALPAAATLTCPSAYQVSNQGGQWVGAGGWSQRGGLSPTGSEKIEGFYGALYQHGFMICLYWVSGHYNDGKFARVAKPAPGAPLPMSGIWECDSWYRTNCSCWESDPQPCAFPQSGSDGPMIGY